VLTYVVRYLGPTQFGLLSYAIAFVGLFTSIATLGLDSILVRELVAAPDKRNELLGTAFVLKLFGSSLMLLLILLTTRIIGNDSFSNLLIIIIASGAFFQATNIVDCNFQANVQSRFSVQALFIQTVFSALIKVYLVLAAAPLVWFAVAVLLDSLILSTGLIANYQRVVGRVRDWTLRADLAISLIKDAWPLIFAGLSVALYIQLDQVMIRMMLDTKSVGEYAVAARLGEAWNFIPMLICSSLFPAVNKARMANEKIYLERMQSLYDLMTWIVLPLAVIVTVFSKPIIQILFGVDFIDAAPVLSMYIWSGLAVFLGVASSQFLTAENLLKISFYRTFLGAVVNFCLNLFLIPQYGIFGAAVATVISYFLATFSIFLFSSTRPQGIMMLKAIFLFSTFGKLLRKT
jgi:O-antigen/teichoic acid export membrane protein